MRRGASSRGGGKSLCCNRCAFGFSGFDLTLCSSLRCIPSRINSRAACLANAGLFDVDSPFSMGLSCCRWCWLRHVLQVRPPWALGPRVQQQRQRQGWAGRKGWRLFTQRRRRGQTVLPPGAGWLVGWLWFGWRLHAMWLKLIGQTKQIFYKH
jgi:hypothetical protein